MGEGSSWKIYKFSSLFISMSCAFSRELREIREHNFIFSLSIFILARSTQTPRHLCFSIARRWKLNFLVSIFPFSVLQSEKNRQN